MKKKWLLLIIYFICSLFLVTSQETYDSQTILAEHEKRIDAIQTDLDYVWVLICAALVFFMQAGFMSLEAGMARSKNSINVAIKNLTDFVLGVIGFWVIGFGLMFGQSKLGFVGTSDFLISIKEPWTAAFFMFQSVFVGTAATIDSGAVCERAKLKQYILLSLLLSIIIYPVFGHWVWGSFLHGVDPVTGVGAGWLEARGFKDFAGSSVVHSVGGWMALAGTIIVGPRIGKFEIDPVTGKKTKPNKIQPGDMRFVFLGVFILFFGWFGFNCGSTLAAIPEIAGIALNTILGACFGCVVSSFLSWKTHPEKKIEGDMIANGILGGLVGITAGCAYVDAAGAVAIGSIAGLVVFLGDWFIQNVLKLDDVVSAVPVHGMCGAWGTLAVGFFIRKDLLGEMSRIEQIQIQGLGMLVCFAWAFGLGLLFYFLVDRFMGGVRVSEAEELVGLNVAEHGATSSLLELANTVNHLTQTGNFENHEGIDVDHGTEVGDLAHLFNNMIFKISEALKESRKQKQMAEEMLKESQRQQQLAEEAEKELEKNRTESNKKQKDYIEQAQNMVGNVIVKAEGIGNRMKETTQVTSEMYQSSHQLSETLNQMLDSLTSVNEQIRSVSSVTQTASQTGKKTKMTITELRKITGEISSMINFINEIAERTHILSINTAIEAARAQAAGKGFTIISKEVQHLSNQTSTAVVDIGEKVKGIEDKINNVISSMDNITEIVNQIDELNTGILKIVEINENYTYSLEKQSKETIQSVEGVSLDINSVVTQVQEVSEIGEKVKQGLADIGKNK